MVKLFLVTLTSIYAILNLNETSTETGLIVHSSFNQNKSSSSRGYSFIKFINTVRN